MTIIAQTDLHTFQPGAGNGRDSTCMNRYVYGIYLWGEKAIVSKPPTNPPRRHDFRYVHIYLTVNDNNGGLSLKLKGSCR